jgi:hypothetical protein
MRGHFMKNTLTSLAVVVVLYAYLFLSKFDPSNSAAWIKFAELEAQLQDFARTRAIFELAVAQSPLSMPKLLWKVTSTLRSRKANVKRHGLFMKDSSPSVDMLKCGYRMPCLKLSRFLCREMNMTRKKRKMKNWRERWYLVMYC